MHVSLLFSNCNNVTALSDSQIVAGPAIVEVSRVLATLLFFTNFIQGLKSLEDMHSRRKHRVETEEITEQHSCRGTGTKRLNSNEHWKDMSMTVHRILWSDTQFEDALLAVWSLIQQLIILIKLILESRLRYSAASPVGDFDVVFAILLVLTFYEILHIRIGAILRSAQDRRVPSVAKLI